MPSKNRRPSESPVFYQGVYAIASNVGGHISHVGGHTDKYILIRAAQSADDKITARRVTPTVTENKTRFVAFWLRQGWQPFHMAEWVYPGFQAQY